MTNAWDDGLLSQQVVPFGPAERGESLPKGADASLSFRIALGKSVAGGKEIPGD
jgi:hypothetical protein